MADRLNEALEEAIAAAPSGVVLLHMVTLDHPSFDAPIHCIMGSEEDVTVTLETDEVVTMTADPENTSQNRVMGFEFVPPGVSDDGPTSARLRLDGASGKLYPHLKAAARDGGAITVTYRMYRSDDLTEPGEVIEDMRMKNVPITGTSAEGELEFEDTSTQAFPRVTYGIDEYPAIWNQ